MIEKVFSFYSVENLVLMLAIASDLFGFSLLAMLSGISPIAGKSLSSTSESIVKTNNA